MCICRICLTQDQTIVSLDRNNVKDSQIFHMLDDLVHPCWYSTRAKLPDEMCKSCIDGLEKAFEFKQKYKESIFKFAQDQNGNKDDAVVSSDKNNQNSQDDIVFIVDSDNDETI